MDGCQHQVIDQNINKAMYFCLVFKEYLHSCPKSCPYRKDGSTLILREVYQKNFDMECIYFFQLVKCTPNDNRSFICERSGQYPVCKQCPLTIP